MVNTKLTLRFGEGHCAVSGNLNKDASKDSLTVPRGIHHRIKAFMFPIQLLARLRNHNTTDNDNDNVDFRSF